MENLLVWILIFAGATIGLLATFLIASERQLQQAQEQEDREATREPARAAPATAYATPRGEEFTISDTHDELARENSKLKAELRSSQTTVNELQEWLVHSQRRQTDLTERAERLEAELDELKRQSRPSQGAEPAVNRCSEVAEVLRQQHEELTREAARLQQQLADEAVKIDALESARQRLADANREVNDDNLRLRGQLDELRQQLHDSANQRERWQQAHSLLSRIVAKQAATADNAQEVQHALLQLTDYMVGEQPGNRPESAPQLAQAIEHDAVELTEGQVLFASRDSGAAEERRPPSSTNRGDMASSALAIAVFVVAIGALASQSWRLNPDDSAAAHRKSLLSVGAAGSIESAAATPAKKPTAQSAVPESDTAQAEHK